MRALPLLMPFLVTLGACSTDAGSVPVAALDGGVVQSDGGMLGDAALPEMGKNVCAELQGGRVSLPADDGVHANEPVEWWYWTGHVHTADNRWFGFEEVFFRSVVAGVPGRMLHSAVTDIDGNQFRHFSTLLPGDLPKTEASFDFSAAGHSVKGANGQDQLVAAGQGYAFSLNAKATKRPVYQHGSGYTDYSFGGNTYYYSRERMAASGTITLDGNVYPVTGTAWFDHQYGDIRAAVNHGWDWFAFQLDDQREIMLFVVRVNGKQELVGASVTSPGCETKEIPASEVHVTALDSWKSPHTTCTYPSGWRVVVGTEDFVVTPYLKDQEVYTSVPIYWEGASKVTRASDGMQVGRGYVELSGYCPAL